MGNFSDIQSKYHSLPSPENTSNNNEEQTNHFGVEICHKHNPHHTPQVPACSDCHISSAIIANPPISLTPGASTPKAQLSRSPEFVHLNSPEKSECVQENSEKGFNALTNRNENFASPNGDVPCDVKFQLLQIASQISNWGDEYINDANLLKNIASKFDQIEN